MATIHYDAAAGFWRRAAGLIGRAALPADRAFFIPGCACVHTCGMRFALDLVFVRRDGTVDVVRRGVRPWRIAWGTRRSAGVFELSAGALPPAGPHPGERLTWLPRPPDRR